MAFTHQLRLAAQSLRYLATAQARSRRLAELCEKQKAPSMVSFYHRVADTHPNDWTISRREFQRHVDYCQEHLEGVGLDQVQRRVEGTPSTRPSITFTFDDGYRENCEFALPLLIERKLPCVYFVSIDFIVQQTAFPHDVEAGQHLPVNTVAELRDMADQGIEIGLHTFTHIDFSKHPPHDVVHHEIVEGKDRLEQLIGKKVRYFAVPYGLPQHLTPAVIEATQRAGLDGFCSAFGAYNLPGRDSFHIRRFHGDKSFARFRNWVTFDQKKLLVEPNITYDPAPPTQSPLAPGLPHLTGTPTGALTES